MTSCSQHFQLGRLTSKAEQSLVSLLLSLLVSNRLCRYCYRCR